VNEENITDMKTTEELLALLESKEFSSPENQKSAKEISYGAYKLAVDYYEIVGAVLGSENINQVVNYRKFQEVIWEYQRQHQISGIIIKTVQLGDKTYRFPVPLKELLALENDLDILKAAVPRVIEAFTEYVSSRPLYLCYTAYDKWDGEHHIQTTLDYIKHEAGYAHWAEITVEEDTNVSLSLGWGNPHSSQDFEDLEGDEIAFKAVTLCHWHWHIPLKIQEMVQLKTEIITISPEKDFEDFKDFDFS
jgi:hypothetical protein